MQLVNPEMLLHICCAPDATVPVMDLLSQARHVRGFFYGSNIHPYEEYARRLEAVKILAAKTNLEVEIAEYNPDEWLIATRDLRDEPEGGKRCDVCFRLQLEAAARHGKSCTDFCTSLTISPHKNVQKIFAIGSEIASNYGLNWQNIIWRKNDGFKRSVQISRELGLYRQNYCGCMCSYRPYL